ncbi:DUF1330 domain-containing protein [Nocardia farcinica]|uniref:DUF1330 domain-containing protein n=1 Tax=Nocardia farcinica TaxID=37329 RepID=UPI0037A66C83
MPKGYAIFTEAVHDPAGMVDYNRAAAPAVAKFGGTVLAAEPAPQPLEGQWHGSQTVILEFDSVETARAWYESPEYQQAKALREQAAQTNAVIVAGFEMPPRR